MLLQARFGRDQIQLQPDEFLALLKERRETIEQVAADASLESSVAVGQRHGWKATLTILKRTSEGHVLARVTVLAPHLTKPYTRNLRMLRRRPLRLVSG